MANNIDLRKSAYKVLRPRIPSLLPSPLRDTSGNEALNYFDALEGDLSYLKSYGVGINTINLIITEADIKGIQTDLASKNLSIVDLGLGTYAKCGIYAFGKYIIGGSGGIVRYSFDGLNWTNIDLMINEDFVKMAFNANGIVGVLKSGHIVTSNNGLLWTLNTTFTLAGEPTDITTQNGFFIVVGKNGMIYRSADNGLNWIQRNYGTQFNTNAVAVVANDTRFLLIDDSGNVGISTNNGLDWSFTNIPMLPHNLKTGTWYIGQFIFVGSAGQYATTLDGLAWEFGVINPSENFTTIAYQLYEQNGVLFVAGLNGVIYGTTDLMNWSRRVNVNNVDINAILYGSNRLFFVGDNRFVQASMFF